MVGTCTEIEIALFTNSAYDNCNVAKRSTELEQKNVDTRERERERDVLII